jgi:hypothetical protein
MLGEDARRFARVQQSNGAISAGSAAQGVLRQTKTDQGGEPGLLGICHGFVAVPQNVRPDEGGEESIGSE